MIIIQLEFIKFFQKFFFYNWGHIEEGGRVFRNQYYNLSSYIFFYSSPNPLSYIEQIT